jgi:3-oxoacyl-[acyl-carrier protein] reductase
MRLRGKVAIVTGGGVGIGKAYSLRLAQEGAKVVIADIAGEAALKTAEEIKASGGEAVAVVTDVSDEKSVIEMAKKAYERFGRIDILVNNAALFTAIERKPWDQVTVEEWDRVMAVNLRGPWLCSKAVFPYMKKQGKGKIINISSSTIFTGGRVGGLIHYVTSKGGVMAFTRALAREVGEYNINVNTITPGFTVSENVAKIYPLEVRNSLIKTRCLKREEKPEDLTGTVVFLASDDSDFITGQIINVDGGDVFY